MKNKSTFGTRNFISPSSNVAALLLSLLVAATPMPAQTEAAVELVVLTSPIPAPGTNGKRILAYELHVTSFGQRDLAPTRLDVMEGDKVLATYESSDLQKRLRAICRSDSQSGDITIVTGCRVVVYIWLALEPREPLPERLRHRLVFQRKTPEGSVEVSVEGGETRIVNTPLAKLAPPLRGALWLAGKGPSNDSDHRRVFYALEGKVRNGQRFATDWVQFGPNNKQYKEKLENNSDHYAYGAEVLAVGDGIISALKDGIVENTPLSRAVPITLDTLAGNYLILDLGHNHFASYVHLQPGSLRVHVGSHVRRGQVLALVGNSGNSDVPHLHFQLCDANSIVGCEGIPFVFSSFDLTGQEGHNFSDQHVERRRNEMPLWFDLVTF